MAGLPIVRWLARMVSEVFYRVERAGHVPESGAVLLLPNHPNALLDPAIVWATAGRDVRFLAKSTLFSGPFAPVLKAAGAIPVYRRLDQGVDTSRNAETFEAVDRALAAGDAICIFPEGISHSTGRLAALRTGAARMALGAERQGVAVQLVPVGLNFDRKTVFRSRVIVLYGRAFSARDLAAGDGPEAVRLLTDRITDQMRQMLVEADPESDEAMVRRVERLYSAARGRPATPEERVSRRQTIARGIETLRAADGARYVDLSMRLRRYDRRLQRFRLRDAQLDWDVSTRAAASFAIREGLAAIVLLPVAAAGLAAFWIPYMLTDTLAPRAADDREVAATAKVFVGAAVYAGWLAVLVLAVWSLLGRGPALIAIVLLPVLAVASLFAIEHESAAFETARAWLMLRRTKRQSRASLKRTRAEIATLLADVHEWLSAETRERPAAQRPH